VVRSLRMAYFSHRKYTQKKRVVMYAIESARDARTSRRILCVIYPYAIVMTMDQCTVMRQSALFFHMP